MNSLLKFFSLTYAVTWTCFIAGAAMRGAAGSSGSPLVGLIVGLLILIGTVAPSLVALWLTARAEGRAGALALLGRVLEWRVGARWYVFAICYMAAIKLAVAFVHYVAIGAWPRFGHEPWYIILAAIPLSTPVQAGEEIGWRGYALPRLAKRFGLGGGSVLLGVIGATWHLPLFFIPGVDKTGQSFLVYVLQVTALTVAVGWLYAHTKGSLLLAMLMHSAVNQSVGIVPSVVPTATNPFALSVSPVAWLTVTLLWITAGYFLVRMPTQKLRAVTASDLEVTSA